MDKAIAEQDRKAEAERVAGQEGAAETNTQTVDGKTLPNFNPKRTSKIGRLKAQYA